MKVCTDSCLFGAWVANEFKDKQEELNILDIGAGTGLLSLLLAQKLSSAIIDAVEIEPSCFEQAERNISLSPWREKIRLHNADIKEFIPRKKYDIIISNPPFYESDLASDDVAKNIAHHDAGLTLPSLLEVVKKLLKEDGCFAVLLPYHRTFWFESKALEEGLFVKKKLCVKQSERHSFFRAFLLLSNRESNLTEEEIEIRDSNQQYTPAFISLLKDYYFYL